MKILWYSVFSFLFFLFRTDGEKGHLDKKNFCQRYGNFSKILLKITWSQLFEVTIMSHIYSSIMKDTWELKILQTWISIHANLSWPVFMKRILMKGPAKLSLAQKARFALQRTFQQHGRWHLTYFYMLLLLSMIPNFQILSSVDWIIMDKIGILFYHLIIIYCSRDLEVQPLSLRFFRKKSKKFNEAQLSCLIVPKCFNYILIFYKILVRGNAKKYSWG